MVDYPCPRKTRADVIQRGKRRKDYEAFQSGGTARNGLCAGGKHDVVGGAPYRIRGTAVECGKQRG